MADIYAGLTIKFGAETTGLSAALRNINRDARGVSTELRKIDRALQFNPGNTDLLAQKQQRLQTQLENTRTRLDALRQAQEQLGDEDIDSDQYRALQREIIETESRMGNLTAALERVKREQDLAGNAAYQHALKLEAQGKKIAEAGDRMKKFGDGMSQVGSTLSRNVTMPLLAAAGAATAMYLEYDSAFAGVRKTTDMTAEQYRELSDAIVDMSRSLPTTAADIAKVVEAAGQLGIENENLLTFSRTMVDLGESTNLTADQAATAFARFANITQMPQTEFDKLGSVVVALGNNFATTEAEIVEFMMRIAGAGTQVGLVPDQMAAIAAALSSVGLEAEAGGTAISKTLIAIENEVATNGAMLKTWAATAGMSADAFTKAWESDPAAALMSVVDGLGRMEEQGGSTLAQLEQLGITEVRQRDALLRMSGASEVLAEALGMSGQAWADNSALAEEAAKRYETPAAQLKMAKNEAIAAGIALGDELAPALLDAAKWAGNLAKGFANLNSEDKKLIIQLAATAAAIGPVTKATGSMISGVGSVVKGYGQASASLAAYSAKLAASGTASAGAIKAVGALSTGLSALGPIAAVAATVGVAALVGKLMYMQTETYKSKQAFEEASQSWVTMADLVAEKQGQLGNVTASSGATIVDVNARIAAAQGKIAETLNAAVMESGALRSEDVANVRAYYDEIATLAADKASGLLESMSATSYQVKALQGQLSADETAQYVADIGEKYKAAVEAYSEGHASEIARINEDYKARGELGSAAYNAEIKAQQESYEEQLAAAAAFRDENMGIINQAFAEQHGAAQAGWLLSQTAMEEGAAQAMKGTARTLDRDGAAAAQEAQRVGAEIANKYRTGLEMIDMASSTAMLSAAASIRASGGEPDAAMKETISAMLATLAGFPPGAEAEATKAAQALASGLSDQIPALKDAGTMTAAEIVAVLSSELGVSYSVGSTAGTDMAAGMSGTTETAGTAGRTVADSALAGARGGLDPMGGVGTTAAGAMVAGVSGGASRADAAGGALGGAARAGAQSGSSGLSTDGEHAAANFAGGLGSKKSIGWVVTAATNLAAGVRSVLGHSVPETGPLKRELEWMPHFVQNLADGLESSAPTLIKSAEGVAASLAEAIQGRAVGRLDLIGGNSVTKSSTSNTSNTITINIDASKASPNDFATWIAAAERAARMGAI